jgi:hypothetical protein
VRELFVAPAEKTHLVCGRRVSAPGLIPTAG